MNFKEFVLFLLESPKWDRVWNLIKQRYYYDLFYTKFFRTRIHKEYVPYWKAACNPDLDVQVAKSRGYDL